MASIKRPPHNPLSRLLSFRKLSELTIEAGYFFAAMVKQNGLAPINDGAFQDRLKGGILTLRNYQVQVQAEKFA
jgi:hypothetical protein